MVSSVTLDFEKKLGGLADSPSYDNVTLDDLLVATTSWADYLQGESERIGVSITFEQLYPAAETYFRSGLNNESYKEPTVPSDPPSSNTSRTKEDKKRSWFFNSNKSLKVRVTLPGKFYLNHATKWSEILPPSRPPPHCLQHPEQHTAKLRKEPNSGTSRLKNPPEDEQQTEVREPTLPNNVETARSHFEATTTVDDGVTLRYRCYNLTSTPETTV
uniref:PNT domain-containing protein n=1 Tax=Angiostrongylus cantonensis TaxID=6313 RepID=A0A0K0D0D0_ANGCA